ncbi:fasciclin domain-containing protein [Aquiflexum gelatinilyticum]|uniref:fasciclin domain-containing protein n=1 Tax=Aquiflexum gelatinilyticum TaxID=2961943 RepID=UPI00216939D8|nr:fasciclin domain-containing protein [Aquiflexum gelatinilyticum]MCS4436647.1 fasciclin domain-containing protein [Aquiflexum gelatinilyticum]
MAASHEQIITIPKIMNKSVNQSLLFVHFKQIFMNIVETAVENGSFKTLVAAVTAAELVETLNGEGPFTVFAPLDTAFEKLPEGTVESLILPENKAQLKGILTYHVIAGEVMSGDLSDGMVATTVNGAEVAIHISDGKVFVNDAEVVSADIKTDNGVIHVINKVIMPA